MDQKTGGTETELARIRKQLADCEEELDRQHASSMELAMGISDCFSVLTELQQGNLEVRVGNETLSSGYDLVATLGNSINNTIAEIKRQHVRVDEYHQTTMDIAMGLSECFAVLAEVREGNLEARVGDGTLTSGDEMMMKLGQALNETVASVTEQVALIKRQQEAIRELSTPVLRLWDDILVLPIIGVVDTKRSLEIMERLLGEIVTKQARFAIIDITGVDIVDTKTADHFIKVIQAARLLGTNCFLTGIQPAVAQTIVDIGMDLSSIDTLRDLSEGLKECFRQMRSEKQVMDFLEQPLQPRTGNARGVKDSDR